MKFAVFIYFCLSCVLSLKFVLTNQKEKRVMSILIAFWFFFALIIKSRYFPSLNPFPIPIRPFYFMAVLFGILLIRSFSTSLPLKGTPKIKHFIYQKYLFLYFFFNQIVIFIHYFYLNNLDTHEYYYTSYVHFTAIIIYLYFSRNMSLELIKTLFQIVIVVGVATSLVAIVQFSYERSFMRMSAYSRAYGNYFRATGIFPTGYDHGLHLILAIFTSHFMIKNHFIRLLVIILNVIAILILLSRGIYLSLLVAAVYYMMSIAKNKATLIVLSVLIGIVVMWSFFDTYDLGEKIITSDFGGIYEERLMSDTATPRAHYYLFVIESIPDQFLIGYGSRKNNDVYRRGMIAANHVGWADGTRGGIHNMFLEIVFLRGVFVLWVLIAFFVYLLRFIKYYSNDTGVKFLFVIGTYVVALVTYKMTTASFVRSYCGMHVMVYAGIVTGVYYRNIDLKKLYRSLL